MSQRKPLLPFVGTTERGRIVRDESLVACVDSLAFVMGRDTAELVTVHGPGERTWRVYPDQASVDADPEGKRFIAWIKDESPITKDPK